MTEVFFCIVNRLAKRMMLLAIALLLTGCMGSEAFSAEDAAVKFGIETMRKGAVVDEESIMVRQVREIDENSKYVLFSFDRQMNNRPEHCLMLFEAHRNPFGMWYSGSGGGGCGGPVDGAAEDIPGINAGGGSSSGIDDPNGTAQIYGEVNDEQIVKVRVTWDDGAVFDAEMINSSYLIMRDGKNDAILIEGLDADGAVIERINWGPAPGKE